MELKNDPIDGTAESPGRREFLTKSLTALLALGPSMGHLFAGDEPPLGNGGLPTEGFVMESAPGPETVLNGRRCLYFGGTGYFALHGHPEVIEAGIAAFRKYGCHSATSRTGFGNTPVQLELEKKIADYFGTEDSIHFVSGYLDNLFLVQALKARVGAIFIDETAHFSIRDAVYSALKPVLTFKHRDPDDLALKLKKNLKAGDLTKAMIAKYPDSTKDDCKAAIRILMDSGRCVYSYFGGSYITLPHKEGAAPE